MDEITIEKYPAYKVSGEEWIGEIPLSWDVTNLGKILAPVSIKNRVDLPLLSITREKGVIIRDIADEEENHNYIPDDLSNYKVLQKGQFGMNKMKAWQGSYGISNHDGIVSPAYFVFDLIGDFDTRYFHLALRSKLYVSFFASASDGVRVGQWDLSKSRMKMIPFLVPPKEEQTAIARFLDIKSALIDKAIAIKEKQIELLKERRQILIHRAVTRGLTHNVKFKDSGVEWIGEIPEHWEVKRLKTIIKKLESGVSVNASESESANENEIGVLKTSCVYRYSFDPNENKKVFDYDVKKVSCSVKAKCIIISRMNAPELVGASGYVYDNYENLFLPDRLWQAEFESNLKINVQFVSVVIATKGFRDCITVLATGSSPSMKNISKGDFLNLRIPCPLIDEQEEILVYVKKIKEKISKAVLLKEKEIEKLKEYKSSLVNSAVTGKIKVC